MWRGAVEDLGRGLVPVGAWGRGAVEAGARVGSGSQDPRIRPRLRARAPVPCLGFSTVVFRAWAGGHA